MKTAVEIAPALIALMTAIGMFKSSGAIEFITAGLEPILSFVGFPSDLVPLALIRPISGSGATAVYEGILNSNEIGSRTELISSVMLGSTETTFYTIAVYYSAVKARKMRHLVPCCLFGDLCGFVFSTLLVNLLLL
jgi:spore maturation protein B